MIKLIILVTETAVSEWRKQRKEIYHAENQDQRPSEKPEGQ